MSGIYQINTVDLLYNNPTFNALAKLQASFDDKV